MAERYTNCTDASIWRAYQEGDAHALVFIYQQWYRDLYSYGYKISRNKDLTKDCIQDIFTQLWLNRERVNAVEKIKPYLLKYLRRQLIRKNDQGSVLAGIESTRQAEFELVLSPEELVISEQMSQEIRTNLQAALGKLSKRQREIIYLRFYEDLSYETIAEVMVIQYQSVRNLVHEAMKVLREHLGLVVLLALNEW